MQDLPPDTPKKQMTVLDMQWYITRKLWSAKLVRWEKTYKQNQNIKEAESKSIY